MSFDTTPPRNDYVGTGALDTYDFDFRIFAETDLRVTVQDTAGAETVLEWPTDFTVAAGGVNNHNGGSIVLVDGNLTDDYLLTIRFDRTPQQTTDLRNQGSLSLEVLEDKLDELTRYVQALRDVVARSLHLPETEAGTEIAVTVPTLALRSGNIASWDSDGNFSALAGLAPTDVAVSAYMEGVVAAANAAAARALLEAAAVEPADNVFRITGSADGSKKVAFEVDGLTGSTTRTVTMPDKSGTLAMTDDAPAASTSVAGLIELATQAEVDAGTPVRALTTDLNLLSALTEQSTSSGTAFDFTIPAGTRRIIITFRLVSLSGTDNILVQLGDAGGIESTAYTGESASITAASVAVASSTAGFIINGGVAASSFVGTMELTWQSSALHTWISTHSLRRSTTTLVVGAGMKQTSAAVTTVRITRDGTDTFDFGVVNVHYER